MRVCGKAEEQPSPIPSSLSSSYRLPFDFSADFFQPQQFSGENLWLFVSGFVCTCATSLALGELRFLRWLCSMSAVTRGLSARGRKFSHCSFLLQLFKHSFDVLNFRSNVKNGSVQNHLLMQTKLQGPSVYSTDISGADYPAHTQQCIFPSCFCNAGTSG